MATKATDNRPADEKPTTYQACNFCKSRHLKCDGGTPVCTHIHDFKGRNSNREQRASNFNFVALLLVSYLFFLSSVAYHIVKLTLIFCFFDL